MLTRSLLESYIGMFLSVCSILNARSFPAARSHLWIDRPHCRDLRNCCSFYPALDTGQGFEQRFVRHAERRGLNLRFRTGRRNAKISHPNDRHISPLHRPPRFPQPCLPGKTLRIEISPGFTK